MNSILKRTISILLVFVMCISMLPASALAEDAEEPAETEETVEATEPVETEETIETTEILTEESTEPTAEEQTEEPSPSNEDESAEQESESEPTKPLTAESALEGSETTETVTDESGKIAVNETTPEIIFREYDSLDADGIAYYIIRDCVAEAKIQIKANVESAAEVTYLWAIWDNQTQEYTDISAEDNPTSATDTLCIYMTEELANKENAIRLTVETAYNGNIVSNKAFYTFFTVTETVLEPLTSLAIKGEEFYPTVNGRIDKVTQGKYITLTGLYSNSGTQYRLKDRLTGEVLNNNMVGTRDTYSKYYEYLDHSIISYFTFKFTENGKYTIIEL